MEKIVSNGDRDCTVVLDGTECSVKFDRCFRAFSVQNNSTSDVFVSVHQGANAGDDGVMRIKSGTSACYPHMRTDVDTVYLNGTGEIQVHGQNTDNNSFHNAPVSSGGGGSEVDAYSKTESDARYPLKGDIPTSLPANGGNADTVNGHTVNANVPEDAKFTDTLPDLTGYALLTDIPASLPANGGNADTVGGKSASDFATANSPRITGDMVFNSPTNTNRISAIYSVENSLVLRNTSNDFSSVCDMAVRQDGVFVTLTNNGSVEIHKIGEPGYVTGVVSCNYGGTANVSFGFTPSFVLYSPTNPTSGIFGSIYLATQCDENGFKPETSAYRQEAATSGFEYIAFK